MTEAEKINLFWPMILSAIFFIAWLVRIEVRSQQTRETTAANKKETKAEIAAVKAECKEACEKNEAQIEKVFDLHADLSEKISGGLTSVNISLARIEGALGLKKE